MRTSTAPTGLKSPIGSGRTDACSHGTMALLERVARNLLMIRLMDDQSSTAGRLGRRRTLGTLALLAQLASCGPARAPSPPQGPPLTIAGTVVGVDNVSPEDQLARGLRVTVQPDGERKVLVDLAPGWYLNQRGLHFSERDRLSVEGRLSPGDPAIAASRVTKGTTTVALRDAAGRPLWHLADAGADEH